ncbi:MAG: uroporphyrinogen decarboxylase family protein [Candidatus Coatesbacteria bacterium]
MTSRERLKLIIARKGAQADRCGFWLGNPHGDAWPLLNAHFGTKDGEELRAKLHDDFRWIAPWEYRDPSGRPQFPRKQKASFGEGGVFADCEDPKEVDRHQWGRPEYMVIDGTIEALRGAGDCYRASGAWTCFYHDVMDLFGMENYMEKMYTAPEVVRAVTDRVCEFYYGVNERLFPAAKGHVDAFFLGNDFGTQLDVICGPAQFDEFILPWFRKFTDQGHRHGLQVILHSCGSVHRVIDRLIDAGVDCLHPLQARARGMEAERLARDFGGRIAFMGGIDTQELLVRGTPEEVREDVRRVKSVLGPNLIVSPSHEAILPDVPPANIEAMAKEAIQPLQAGW